MRAFKLFSVVSVFSLAFLLIYIQLGHFKPAQAEEERADMSAICYVDDDATYMRPEDYTSNIKVPLMEIDKQSNATLNKHAPQGSLNELQEHFIHPMSSCIPGTGKRLYDVPEPSTIALFLLGILCLRTKW